MHPQIEAFVSAYDLNDQINYEEYLEWCSENIKLSFEEMSPLDERMLLSLINDHNMSPIEKLREVRAYLQWILMRNGTYIVDQPMSTT